MIIGNVTAAQVSTLVWSAAARTLTADPATDLGAATLVWNHAGRTLTADPATDAGAATLVWTHGGRTLTADPATDAGCATFVWTHATRTLSADPATDAGAATLVWAHATRSLTVDPATDAGAATLVWARATRTLTAFGTAITVTNTTNTVIASGGGSVTFQPAAGKAALCSFGVNLPAGGAGNMSGTLTDGTNSFTLFAPFGASSSAFIQNVLIGNGWFIQLNNNNSNNGHYTVMLLQFNP